MKALTTRPRLFYGWIVVWAGFACLAVVFGISYSFAAFFGSFAEAFAARRADVSLVFGLSGLLYFALGAAGGAMADRLGPRPVATAGMAIVVAGLVGASFAGSLSVVYLMAACAAFSAAATWASWRLLRAPSIEAHAARPS